MSDQPTEPAPEEEEKKEKPDLPPIPDEVREASLRQMDQEKSTEKEPNPLLPTAEEPPAIEYTIIGDDGEEYGPASMEDVTRWIHTGKVNSRTLIRIGKESPWEPINQLPELSALLTGETPAKKPGKVTAIAIMTLIGGIWAVSTGILEALGVISSFCLACFLIPGSLIAFFGGIFIIVQGALLLGQNPAKHLSRTRISASLQIACILAGDVTNLMLGILNHVFLSDDAVIAYRKKTDTD